MAGWVLDGVTFADTAVREKNWRESWRNEEGGRGRGS